MSFDGKDGHVSCVFDLETKPDKFAKVLARRRRLKASSPLHEISTASAMDLTFDVAGQLTSMTLRTWHEDEMPEKDIIAGVSVTSFAAAHRKLCQHSRARSSGG